MSRIRTIKPEFWTSEQIMECSPLARLAFIGMWNFCDDNGVHPASCKTLKAEVFPGDDITAADVQTLVSELIHHGLLVEFHTEGRRWWFVTGWHHQLINRPSKSRYPLPPRHAPPPKDAGPDADQGQPETATTHGTLMDGSVSTHGTLMEDSLQEGKGKEGKGRERKGKEGSVSPPSASRPPSRKTACPADLSITPELQAWADQHGYRESMAAHLESFVGKATANGYAYADWQAALRNAIRDDWAGLRKPPPIERAVPGGGRAREKVDRVSADPRIAEVQQILAGATRAVIEGECAHVTH